MSAALTRTQIDRAIVAFAKLGREPGEEEARESMRLDDIGALTAGPNERAGADSQKRLCGADLHIYNRAAWVAKIIPVWMMTDR